MAIVVECERCRRITHFADNDAGLAVSCIGCGQRTRVPDSRPKLKPAPPPSLPKLTRVKASAGRPLIYAAGLLLVLGTAIGLGYLKYRSVVNGRDKVAPTAVASFRPATAPPIQSTASPRPIVDSAAVTARKVEGPARVVGFVGLDRLELNGRYVVDSYNSAQSSYEPAAARGTAPLVSNLKVRLYGSGKVAGIVRVGKAGDIKKADGVEITSPPDAETGPARRLLDAPDVDASAAQTNDNDRLPERYFQGGSLFVHARRSVAIPAGVYRFKDLVIETKATLVLDGPATFIVTGRLIIYGAVETHDRRPGNLRLLAKAGEEPVSINNASDLYIDLYAPGRVIEIYGKGDVYGSVVGKVLRVNGERGLHFDELIPRVLEGIAPTHATEVTR
jgi:hypothetical protein